MTERVLIGIDIGGTKTHGVAFGPGYRTLAEHRAPTPGDGGESVAAGVNDVITQLSRRLDGRTIAGIGIGVPGLVDRSRGRVRAAVNLGIGDEPLDLAARIAAAHPVPCRIDNDVNVGALGARQLLAPDVADLAYLSIGTGVAAGVILGGRLRRGHSGVAGEIGHFPIVSDGPRCDCGLDGCLEAVASGRAIGRRWASGPGRSPAESLVDAAEAGDERAAAVLAELGDHLASAVYLLGVTYDVGRIVIGGGVADVGPRLLRPVRSGLARLEARSALVRSLDLPSRVTLTPAGPVGAVGAAVLADAEVDR